MKINLILTLLITCFGIFNPINAQNLQIKYKINNTIITNVDIEKQKNYLLFLRPNLEELPKEELTALSINSLITNIIKNKEIEKSFETNKNYDFLEKILENLYKAKGVKNIEEFKVLLGKNNLEYEELINKIKLEALWNRLIYLKFNSLVKIDKNYLKQNLEKRLSREKKYEYDLSEILFEIEADKSMDEILKKITKSIDLVGFENTAIKYSISNSSKKGGNIGKIKETLLNQSIITELKKTKIGNYTKPIESPNGFILLKINSKKEMVYELNINKELNEMIEYEKNNQLNQFSLLFYKRLKQNSKINEY
tara:strand:+ start:98 stop:1027 length:930 start_codon:yes stop_codon:yes gene_type:complete